MIDKIKNVYEVKIESKEQIKSSVLENIKVSKHSKNNYLKSVLALCCIAIIVLGASMYGIMVEAKEYNEAVDFFNQYNLSMQGLTRDEIKNVYKDIKTEKFDYNKTKEVLINTTIGYEIMQLNGDIESLSTEAIFEMWGQIHKYGFYSSNQNNYGVRFEYEEIYTTSEDEGTVEFDKSVFRKYNGNELIWETDVSYAIRGYRLFQDKVYVYGDSVSFSFTEFIYIEKPLISCLNSEGEVEWTKKFEHDFNKYEDIADVVFNDKSIVVFSIGDSSYICMTKMDFQGNEKSSVKNKIGNYGIRNVAKLGNGYIALINSNYYGQKLIKIDENGSITDSFVHSTEEEDYYIVDMAEYNGQLYLSAYAVDKLKAGEGSAGGRHEIARVLNYVFDNKRDISNDELTKLVKDNYTAVLLVCDLYSGIPSEFYTVKGSLGGKLAINDDNKLVWSVENIENTFYSIATSSFTIGGVSRIDEYYFDLEGKLVEQVKTDNMVQFRR